MKFLYLIKSFDKSLWQEKNLILFETIKEAEHYCEIHENAHPDIAYTYEKIIFGTMYENDTYVVPDIPQNTTSTLTPKVTPPVKVSNIADSYDWIEAFKYSNGKNVDEGGKDYSFDIADIKDILALEEGENDGANWIIYVKLKNGLYGFLAAGCDYTGWDCQASGSSYVSKSKERLIRYGMGEDDRKRLGLSLPDDFNNGRTE